MGMWGLAIIFMDFYEHVGFVARGPNSVEQSEPNTSCGMVLAFPQLSQIFLS
jgi:hypothetical protein